MPNHRKPCVADTRYGSLVVIERAGIDRGYTVWKFRCDCGETVVRRAHKVYSGEQKSCGCLRKQCRIVKPGDQYGRLTALECVGKGHNGYLFRWACQCGKTAVKSAFSVHRGAITSCGCLRRENIGTVRYVRGEGEASLTALYWAASRKARDRGLSFELSREDYRAIVTRHCAYCGAPPKPRKSHETNYNGALAHNGIDRIDNGVGYTLANSTPCCKTCNSAKGTQTLEEFKAWIARAARYLAL